MDFMSYVVEQALILIPVLFLLGKFLKSSSVPDKFIPLTLLAVGVILSMFMLGFTVNGFIQGVLVAGAAVFTNEVVKQANRE